MSKFMAVYQPTEEGLGLISNGFFKLVAVTMRRLTKDRVTKLIKELGTEKITQFFDTIFNAIKDQYKDDLVKELNTWKIWTDEYGESRGMDMFPDVNGYRVCVTSIKNAQDITTWKLALVLYDKKCRYKNDSQYRMFHFKVTKTIITTVENVNSDDMSKYIDPKKLKLPFKMARN